jgi:hypothetical protein
MKETANNLEKWEMRIFAFLIIVSAGILALAFYS